MQGVSERESVFIYLFFFQWLTSHSGHWWESRYWQGRAYWKRASTHLNHENWILWYICKPFDLIDLLFLLQTYHFGKKKINTADWALFSNITLQRNTFNLYQKKKIYMYFFSALQTKALNNDVRQWCAANIASPHLQPHRHKCDRQIKSSASLSTEELFV